MLPQRPWNTQSPIQALVGAYCLATSDQPLTTEQACDPTLPEPNHAVNIELAELINKKKANRWVYSVIQAQLTIARARPLNPFSSISTRGTQTNRSWPYRASTT